MLGLAMLWRQPLLYRLQAVLERVRHAGGASALADSLLPPPAGSLRFAHVVVDPAFHGDCKAVGDINGDGRSDLVVAGKDGLAWYAAPAVGNLEKRPWPRHNIAKPRIEFTTDMQVGDVDRDGDLDVIVPDGDKDDNVLWFENADHGKGRWKRHVIGAAGDWAHDVEVGDLDRDGKLDVVVRQGRTTMFFQNTPDDWQKATIDTKGRGGTAVADLDGDTWPDLAQNGYWLRNPGSRGKAWKRYEIARGWPEDVGVSVGDLNGDGRPDVVLSPAESSGRMVWYESPPDLAKAPERAWTEHVIGKNMDFVHTFKLADMNGDGALDLAFAEMAQAPHKRVGVFLNQGAGRGFDLQILSTQGSHNIRVADFNDDGRPDVAGANWQGPPVEVWLNQGRDPLGAWHYINVDGARDERAFGLVFPPNEQGGHDIVAGHVLYRNPGGDLTGPWAKTELPKPIDVMWTYDVSGDGKPDLIGEALGRVLWLEAGENGFTLHEVAKGFAPTDHTNSQGYAQADLAKTGRPQLVFTTGKGIHALQVPNTPEAGWRSFQITGDETSEEGIGVADIDGDGWLDITAAAGKDGNELAWWRNPGGDKIAQEIWAKTPIGKVQGWADRNVLADLSGDGRPDLIVSIENGEPTGAPTYWYENPKQPAKAEWVRHTLAVQGSTNALDVADVDGDGRLDVITGEHRGQKRVIVWRNLGGSGFEPHVVDQGKESHLGARAVDLDGDGDLDLVSIAWDGYRDLHVWRNDRIMNPPATAER